MKNRIVFFLLILFFTVVANGQSIHPDVVEKKWKAFWIAVPGEPESDYGVYRFRKVIDINVKPETFVIHVSGDNRYKLFVNGSLASLGPARGDLFYWNFETVDIAPFLKTGRNVISAVVWNFGKDRPEAQVSLRTAFIIQGNTAAEEIINTDRSWKCIRDEGYSPRTPDLLYTYYVSGPGEHIDYHKYISGSERPDYNDRAWKQAMQISNGLPKGVFDWSYGWMLVPRTIPPMEISYQRLNALRKAEGLNVSGKFPAEKIDVNIPAGKKVILWLDQGFLTNAYPVVNFSGGKDATITLTYAEAPYKIENSADWKTEKQKGNRNEIEGKRIVGVTDKLVSNGSANQLFTSLWWRTYRYIQLEIETKQDPLTIHDVYGYFTGYPFKFNAQFSTGDALHGKIVETGWRTARLCAVETYMDCPYYEQLQYVGDTRIQALVSLFNSGDDRLMRNAITQLDYSRLSEGLTQSRYPTAHPQLIPTFSLWWIGMVHDYWMYRTDTTFVKSMLPGVRQVLNFFSGYQHDDGSLRSVPYWPFTDWVQGKGWRSGMAPVGSDHSSAILDLQLCMALQLASELEDNLGLKEQGSAYRKNYQLLQETIRAKYWDTSRKLFADTGDKTTFSQHANTLAVLSEVVTGDEAKELMNKVMTDTTLTQATIYFKYYVHAAASKAGLGEQYLEWLGDWKEQLANGLTTWAEVSDYNNARSDCHAWGSSPNIEFFRTVLGIDSDAPGFSRIRIEPKLGKLKQAQGKIPHPKGEIEVSYTLVKKKWKVDVGLPENTPGILIWQGEEYPLNNRQSQFEFKTTQ